MIPKKKTQDLDTRIAMVALFHSTHKILYNDQQTQLTSKVPSPPNHFKKEKQKKIK
jgi:hypothetical protein